MYVANGPLVRDEARYSNILRARLTGKDSPPSPGLHEASKVFVRQIRVRVPGAHSKTRKEEDVG